MKKWLELQPDEPWAPEARRMTASDWLQVGVGMVVLLSALVVVLFAISFSGPA